MPTAIVSGRVDEAVKNRAAIYIHAAGLTFGDVINDLMSHIASNKSIPRYEHAQEDVASDAFDRFMQFRRDLQLHHRGFGVPEMSNAELREYLATERLKDYEALG